MGKLRKTLAIIFALLSLLFAGVALSNKFSAPALETKKTEHVDYAWDRTIESNARNENKLVFFFSDQNVTRHLSASAKKILSKRYISVKISPETFPADFSVLDTPLAKISKKSDTLKAGILSPNLFPVYLTSSVSEDERNGELSLNDAIIVAAKQFKENPYTLKKTAREATSFDALPHSAFNSIFGNSFGRLGFLHAESSRMFIFFNSTAALSAPPATLAENARLAARIAALDFTQLSARNAVSRATEILCARLNSNPENKFENLLYLRALGESPHTTTDTRLKYFYLRNVKKYGLRESESVRELAVSISVLLRAFEISKDKVLFNQAETYAKTLERHASTENVLPAKIGEKSEASSLEYALCARAFWDMSKFSNIDKWRTRTRKILTKWNENFMTPFNLWSINSKKSALAKIARPIITQDSATPSYLGEAAQLFAEIMTSRTSENFNQYEISKEFHLGKTEIRRAQNLKKIAVGAATFSPLNSPRWASLKLAALPTPNK